LNDDFEITDLNKLNPDGLPEPFDTLAVVVLESNIEILDNSTYGYPDALTKGAKIGENGNWTFQGGTLDAFSEAG
jgi:hypothetical protein